MGRSLYLDHERRDVNSLLFSAWYAARRGRWGEAEAEFGRARERMDQLVNLMAAIQLGEVDPQTKEGLAHPSARDSWAEVSDIAE